MSNCTCLLPYLPRELESREAVKKKKKKEREEKNRVKLTQGEGKHKKQVGEKSRAAGGFLREQVINSPHFRTFPAPSAKLVPGFTPGGSGEFSGCPF